MIKLYIEKGNTLRIEVEFYDFDNQPVEPINVNFKVYDVRYNELSCNPLTVNNKIRDSIGKYFIDHVFEQTGTYFIEFIGYVNDKPTLKRDKIVVVFDE